MSTRDAESDGTPGIGTAYAMFQMPKAWIAENSDLDPQTRARADERIARWQRVIAHAMCGTAQFGFRAPRSRMFPRGQRWKSPQAASRPVDCWQAAHSTKTNARWRHLYRASVPVLSGWISMHGISRTRASKHCSIVWGAATSVSMCLKRRCCSRQLGCLGKGAWNRRGC